MHYNYIQYSSIYLTTGTLYTVVENRVVGPLRGKFHAILASFQVTAPYTIFSFP
jgi:hypothetical protein